MKKTLTFILLLAMCVTACSGCGAKEEVDNKPEIIIDKENNKDDQQQEEDEDKTEEMFGIAEKDAYQLVSECVDTEKYNITLFNDDTELNGRRYYLYSIGGADGNPLLAVDKESGEVYRFYIEDTVEEYDGRYGGESRVSQYDFSGVFKTEDESGILEFQKSDSTSAEFNLEYNGDNGYGNIDGVARISGDTAVYSVEGTMSIEFKMQNDGNVTVNILYSDDGYIDFSGEYFRS